MIKTTTANVTVPSGNLQKMFYDDTLIRNLAIQLVAAQVEGHIEMMNDCPGEYEAYEFADACIQDAKVTVNDYINDLMYGFLDQLKAEVKKVKIDTEAVMLKPGREIDAIVNISAE